MNTTHGLKGKLSLAVATTGVLLCASQAALAVPNYSYFKDAETTNNTGSGTKDANVFFSTPILGVAGSSFTQADQTVGATGAGASSSTTFSASIAPGLLGATSMSSVGGTFGGAIGTGLSSFADQQLRFRDLITPTGGTAGDAVSLTLTLALDSILSALNVPTSNSALCGYGSVALSANVGNGQVASLGRNLCLGADTQTVSATFNGVSGTPFELELVMGIFSQSAIGAGNTIGSSVGIDASHTGKASLLAGEGFGFTAESGFSYTPGGGGNPGGDGDPTSVPEPSTLALLGIGLLGWALRARGRPRIN